MTLNVTTSLLYPYLHGVVWVSVCFKKHESIYKTKRVSWYYNSPEGWDTWPGHEKIRILTSCKVNMNVKFDRKKFITLFSVETYGLIDTLRWIFDCLLDNTVNPLIETYIEKCDIMVIYDFISKGINIYCDNLLIPK